MYVVEIYAAVRRFVFIEGNSRREAARVFGLNRETVAKMSSFHSLPVIVDRKYVVCDHYIMDDLSLLLWPRGVNNVTIYPKRSGVYALFLNDGAIIPGVKSGAAGLIYVGIGQGARGLAGRCHIKGRTASHSPRRSLSSLLAKELRLRPIFIRKPSGATTFKLDTASERTLDHWMEQNLSIALHPLDAPAEYERRLITQWYPPLNCDKKVCALNDQQQFVLDQREKFKAQAAFLANVRPGT